MRFEFHVSFFFYFYQSVWIVTVLFMHVDSLYRRKIAVFTGPTTTLFWKKIKNGSHITIHTFKNYFVTVFSVFSFLQNMLHLNGPYMFWKSNHRLHVFYILCTHVRFCANRILFTIWCINLFFIHNIKLQKLAI